MQSSVNAFRRVFTGRGCDNRYMHIGETRIPRRPVTGFTAVMSTTHHSERASTFRTGRFQRRNLKSIYQDTVMTKLSEYLVVKLNDGR